MDSRQHSKKSEYSYSSDYSLSIYSFKNIECSGSSDSIDSIDSFDSSDSIDSIDNIDSIDRRDSRISSKRTLLPGKLVGLADLHLMTICVINSLIWPGLL